MRLANGSHGEEGSTLILGLGLVGVCLLVLAAVTDAGNVFLQHRQLFAMADAAALAGAQSIDLTEYYSRGAREGTRLDPDAVVAGARAHLAQEQETARIPGLHVDSIRSDGHVVVVELSAPVRPAFMSPLEPDSIHVQSTARLDFREG